MIDDFDAGYKAGYKKAYEEIKKFAYSKDISPIDEMYGRPSTMDKHLSMQNISGPTGPIGYIP